MASGVDKQPGDWVRAKARGHERAVLLMLAGAMALMALALFAGLGLRSSLLTLPIVVAMYVLKKVFDARSKDASRWALGARAEVAVGETLNELRREGYFVVHDIEQAGEGNVDHLVCGSTGVYMVETKARRYLESDLRKAARQAAKLGAELGVWVTPVICLHERADAAPYRDKRVWIVPRESLLEWIQGQSNQTLPLDAFARFAGRL